MADLGEGPPGVQAASGAPGGENGARAASRAACTLRDPVQPDRRRGKVRKRNAITRKPADPLLLLRGFFFFRCWVPARPDAGRPRSIRGGGGAVRGSPGARDPAATLRAGPRPRLPPAFAPRTREGPAVLPPAPAPPACPHAGRPRSIRGEGGAVQGSPGARGPAATLRAGPRPRLPRHRGKSEHTPWLPEGKGGSGGVPLLGGGGWRVLSIFPTRLPPVSHPPPRIPLPQPIDFVGRGDWEGDSPGSVGRTGRRPGPNRGATRENSSGPPPRPSPPWAAPRAP